MLSAADLEAIQRLIQTENKPIKEDIRTVKTELKGIKKDVKRLKVIEKKLDITIEFFDKENLKVTKRVDRIETHLELPPLS